MPLMREAVCSLYETGANSVVLRASSSTPSTLLRSRPYGAIFRKVDTAQNSVKLAIRQIGNRSERGSRNRYNSSTISETRIVFTRDLVFLGGSANCLSPRTNITA